MTAGVSYTRCRLCARRCGVDRTRGQTGFCGTGSRLRIAWAGIHRGEEPLICGRGGSGTIFLSGCTLRCFFCQNYQLSHGNLGRDTDVSEFADICLMLERKGAENINIVTGTHFLPSLAEGIRESRERGLTKPVVWNSSGYESSEYLPLLNDFVDIYLPDLKTLDSSLSASMFGVSDYPDAAARAIKEMAASRPLLRRGSSLVSGLIVRHLVLPGLLENTRAVLAWFAENVADRALLSLMFQYTPPAGPVPRGELQGGQGERGEWKRRVSAEEYGRTLAMLDEFGIEEGFVQEPSEDAPPCLPDFSLPDAFPGGLAYPLWFYGKNQAEGAREICSQEICQQETCCQKIDHYQTRHRQARHRRTGHREIYDQADGV